MSSYNCPFPKKTACGSNMLQKLEGKFKFRISGIVNQFSSYSINHHFGIFNPKFESLGMLKTWVVGLVVQLHEASDLTSATIKTFVRSKFTVNKGN